MSMMKKILGLGTGLAAIAAAAPASAQYYGYGYTQPYRYAQSYGYAQPYGYMNTSVATSQCTAAVQNRLYNRTSVGGILGVLLGANTPSGRVLSVTQVNQRSNGLLRVRGLASSGRYAYNGYGPYGVGAYGALGYNYANAADLSFRCDVAPNGAVYSVSINRR
jgi:hypothetical protein